MAADEKDNAPTGETTHLGAGKDLLFGWLVGRAAADLGLAHALAASEAQRVEQMKRLEDSLLAQIHELQSQTNIGGPADRQFAELHDLKASLNSAVERLSRVESMTQQAAQTRDQLRDHAATLQSDVARQQALYEHQSLRLQEIAENLSAKFRDLEERVRSQAQDRSMAETDFPGLADIKVQLGALTARLEQAEVSNRRLQMQASEAVERLHEQSAGLVQRESATLKAELLEHLRGLETPQSSVTELATSMNERLENLRRDMGEAIAARFAQELDGLRSRLQGVTERLDSAPPPAPQDFEAERQRWTREVDQNISASVRRLGDEIRQELRSTASGKVDHANFQTESTALADRIAKTEHLVQQTAESLAAEMGAMRQGLSRQHDRQQATDELLKSLEETLRTKFEDTQNFLVRQQDVFQQRDAQSAELQTQTQRLMQKMADLESTAHRTHALLVNENQQTAQLRESLRGEIDELRGRLNDGPSLAGVVETVESQLSLKASELQNQLSEKLLVVDRRDSEIRELKAQIQTIHQKMMQLETANPTLQSASNRTYESIVAPVEASTLRPPPEGRPRAAAVRHASALSGTQATVNTDAGPKEHLLVEAGRDQIAQLHERISADIERARAELREKSGRWKARR